MTKKEKTEFNKLIAWNEELKQRIKNVNKEKKMIKKEIKELGKALDELERKYKK